MILYLSCMVSFFVLPIFAEDSRLVKFTAEEERLLDDGIRRSSFSRRSKDSSGTQLVEFTAEEEEALSKGWDAARSFLGHTSRAPTRIDPRDYCRHYKANYGYYCIAKTYGNEPLIQKLLRFCPSYKAKCAVHAHGVERDPFHVLQHRISPDFPDVDAHHRRMVEQERDDFFKAMVPCSADCDSRVWRHCTQECKCDYMFPRVQRFCNPPPIPFFLNTCRLWYYGCPKYQQYNYASQFIYSKAEKGKTLGGVSPGVASYGGATPTGFATRLSPSGPIGTPFN
uniref:Uncharacterized protein n=1 Tax=Panagrolaimus sp. JU765 TaxID=591449 RepID=A0AC34QIT5_9BILA